MTDDVDPQEYLHMEPPLTIPADPLAAQRMALADKYGFAKVPDAYFDTLAHEFMAGLPGIDMAGVNRLDDERNQFFTGVAILGATEEPTLADRCMTPFQGACSTFITREPVKGRTAIAFNDLLDFPLFASNDMVTKFGKRTYIAGLIMPPEGIPLGTVWGIGPDPQRWQQRHLDFAKQQAAKAMQYLRERSGA
jgi:hypothetical protein